MDILKNYILLGLSVMVVVLGFSTIEYRRQYKSVNLALTVQNGAIAAQKQAAEQQLEELTKKRDDLQHTYDESRKQAQADKEKFDAELEKLRAARPAIGPVRVRIVPGSCSAGGGGAAAQGGLRPDPAGSAQAQAAATGVLDPAVVGALDGRYTEVELLQRDYNICRADLLSVRGIKE